MFDMFKLADLCQDTSNANYMAPTQDKVALKTEEQQKRDGEVWEGHAADRSKTRITQLEALRAQLIHNVSGTVLDQAKQSHDLAGQALQQLPAAIPGNASFRLLPRELT